MGLNLSLPVDKPFDVVGMGLNSVDFLAILPQFPSINTKMKIHRFSKQGGGQVATAMVALARWGIKTKYIGKVGDDEFGSFSLNSLREEGVDASSVIIEPDTTNQFAMIIVDGISGERTILWDRDERLTLRPDELRREDICSGRILHLDGHDIEAAIQAARWAREDGIPTVIDIDKVEPLTSELIREIDFVITSARFPQLMTGISEREKAFREIQKEIGGFLCSTLGKEGAIALVDGEILYVEGFKIRAVDTTGAGDVFHAGFIYGLLKNWDIREILRFSNAVASLKCLEIGGRKGIPTLEEAMKLLSKSSVS